jgi:chromate transporter
MAWPDVTSLDPAAALLSLVAVIALFRLKLGMIPTLALCGALGFAWRALSGMMGAAP